MKKLIILAGFMLMITATVINAQLPTDSWSVGFGFTYPRYISANVTTLNSNYGGYLDVQRNFSEHVALRFKASYLHLEGQYISPNLVLTTSTTNVIAGDLDFLYYLIPCEPISPYLFGGGGGLYRMLSNQFTSTLDNNAMGAELNAGLGIEMNLDTQWKLLVEFGYHVSFNSELDGAVVATEVNAKDSYLGINVGVSYMFEKGEPSKYCQLYTGIVQDFKDMTNYNKIEDIVVKHIPKEVTKEVVVEKPVAGGGAAAEKWVLVGVNFAFNSSKLAPESYPILYDAAKTLLKNPGIKVEIQGYTDNIGSTAYNKKLSQKRADVVKEYLISKLVSANRLNAVGYGETNPIVDNKTASGRAANRRIEFKIQ